MSFQIERNTLFASSIIDFFIKSLLCYVKFSCLSNLYVINFYNNFLFSSKMKAEYSKKIDKKRVKQSLKVRKLSETLS